MHEDLDVSLAVVHCMNNVGPVRSARSIMDRGLVVFGPVVTTFSPFRVMLNLW